MLLTAIEPALLIYNIEDWQSREEHFFRRLDALSLHRRINKEYDQSFAMTQEFAALVFQFFPWDTAGKQISELRDFRLFIVQELEKSHFVDSKKNKDVRLEHAGILFQYINDISIIFTWEELLLGCIDTGDLTSQIASWNSPNLHGNPKFVSLIIKENEHDITNSTFEIPIVWDEESWSKQLINQDFWPDIHLCVNLNFISNNDIRTHEDCRKDPIPFKCTQGFLKNAKRYCEQENLRRSLINAITKRVYGIRDYGLRDEPFKGIRRMRVSDYWRIHYRQEGDRIIFEEFGRHDIGGVE